MTTTSDLPDVPESTSPEHMIVWLGELGCTPEDPRALQILGLWFQREFERRERMAATLTSLALDLRTKGGKLDVEEISSLIDQKEVPGSQPTEDSVDPKLIEALCLRCEDLKSFSGRVQTCLRNNQIVYIWQLVECREQVLLGNQNFAQRSLWNIKYRLRELHKTLKLDMKLEADLKRRVMDESGFKSGR